MGKRKRVTYDSDMDNAPPSKLMFTGMYDQVIVFSLFVYFYQFSFIEK